MKVICTRNELSDSLLTPLHREYFERHFGPQAPPRWNAEVGRTYTVYGVRIVRGYPFYFVEREGRTPQDWGYIPSVCFDVTDDRPSGLWRLESRIVTDHSGNQIFVTVLAIPEWLNEPSFAANLVDGYAREVEIMRRAAALMDDEWAA